MSAPERPSREELEREIERLQQENERLKQKIERLEKTAERIAAGAVLRIERQESSHCGAVPARP